jgi:hypothetical protein
MKPNASLLLLSILTTTFPGGAAHGECVLPGLERFAIRNGMAPECGMVGTQGFISLHGDTRFSWSRLRVGPNEDMSSLQINGNFASVHVVRGEVFIAGPVSAQGSLALFGAQITTTPTGGISAPELVISAVLPANDEDVDGYFHDTAADLETTSAPGASIPGLVDNKGRIEATQGNLTILGGRIQNAPADPSTGVAGLMAAPNGTVRLVAAERIRASRTQSIPLHGRPMLGNSITNGGTIHGLRVEMRAVPQSCPDEDCFSLDVSIINEGKIKGTAIIRGVTFDVSGGTEDAFYGTGMIENRLDPNSTAKTGTIITPDFQPLLDNDPDYVRGGLLSTTTAQLRPDDGDNPSVTPSRFQPAQNNTSSVPLLPSTSAAGVILRAQPSQATSTADASANSAGTRGPSTSMATEDDPRKRTKRIRPTIIRGAFFGVPVRN